MKWVKLYLISCALIQSSSLFAAEPSGSESIDNQKSVQEYFQQHHAIETSESIYSPHEGVHFNVYNSRVKEWLLRKWDHRTVSEIRSELKSLPEKPLYIPLTDKGFARAATRDSDNDTTNYNAIWVRDAVWVYYSMVQERPEDAGKLIKALWDYYGKSHQWQRMFNIFRNPSLATSSNPTDYMDVPHIRFDGDADDLRDVQVCDEQGACKDQPWNHKQNDAHAMFITAVIDAVERGLVSDEDLNDRRIKSLMFLGHFLSVIEYYNYADSGAWEEIARMNSSSIGLVANSFRQLSKVLAGEVQGTNLGAKMIAMRNSASTWGRDLGLSEGVLIPFKNTWMPDTITDLYRKGKDRVVRQIKMGGESPDYNPFTENALYREADIALSHLVVPGVKNSLFGNDPEQIRSILRIIDVLRRPAGILRYEMDSYQSGNYWTTIHRGWDGYLGTEYDRIKPQDGKTSFLTRFFGPVIENSEAQWFFDSTVAMLYLRLYELGDLGESQKVKDLHRATVHIKRAMAQFTGHHVPNRPEVHGITADGKPVGPWLLPESINTLILDGKRYLVPSPIVPLNWAKASLGMAIDQYLKLVPKTEK